MKSNRRDFINNAGAGTAGLTWPRTPCILLMRKKADIKMTVSSFLSETTLAVADTTYGKVRGYILRDIYYFLGIP